MLGKPGGQVCRWTRSRDILGAAEARVQRVFGVAFVGLL